MALVTVALLDVARVGHLPWVFGALFLDATRTEIPPRTVQYRPYTRLQVLHTRRQKYRDLVMVPHFELYIHMYM